MSNTLNKKILQELKEGSESAFKKVYEDNREKFLNFAKRYELTNDENIDIYQDAYIVFYETFTTGKISEMNSSVSTYLFSIGKYMILNRLRKNKKSVSSELIMEKVKDDNELFDEFVIKNEPLTVEQQLLQKHFDKLGDKCKKVLTLFYYRGFSIQEIMKTEGYNNENVVKSQKSRCLKTLKDYIKNPNPTPNE